MNLASHIIIGVWIAAFSLTAQAAVQQVRVLAVGVDSQRSTAEAKALDYAKKRAVYLVARKLGVDGASEKIGTLTEEDFHQIVRGATVVQMRREGEISYAEVNVSVIDTALRRALDMPDAPADNAPVVASAMGRSVLVLPVLMQEGRPLLWEPENTLREALYDEVLRQAQSAVLVPAGDFDDLRLVDYQNVLSVTQPELEPMFKRYGADELVVAVTTLPAQDSMDGISILLRRLSPVETKVETITVPASAVPPTVEEQIALSAKTIASTLTQIASATSQGEQQAIAQAAKVPVRFHYATMREFAQMQNAVRAIEQVAALDIPTIALGDVDGTIHFTGTREDLRAALNKKQIFVTPSGKFWQLSLRKP